MFDQNSNKGGQEKYRELLNPPRAKTDSALISFAYKHTTKVPPSGPHMSLFIVLMTPQAHWPRACLVFIIFIFFLDYEWAHSDWFTLPRDMLWRKVSSRTTWDVGAAIELYVHTIACKVTISDKSSWDAFKYLCISDTRHWLSVLKGAKPSFSPLPSVQCCVCLGKQVQATSTLSRGRGVVFQLKQ